MTFTIVARCPRTGEIGAAVATDSIASSARVASCAAGVGVIINQCGTDPWLGPRGLALLQAGSTAEQVTDVLMASDRRAASRQIAVLDAGGHVACRSGARISPLSGTAVVQDACAIGNNLSDTGVLAAMIGVLLADPGLPLAERLLRALTEGDEAKADNGTLCSACLLVVGGAGVRPIDLRIDWHIRPVAELRMVWNRYAPLALGYAPGTSDPSGSACAHP
jgi:uncharacterized Ntn-hydrolase superfamily protein